MASSSKSEDPTYADVRDSYAPVFSGQPSEYKEWRQRAQLYYRKMTLSKRAGDGVVNIVGSFKGVVWRLFEDWSLDQFEKGDAFETMLKVLDGNFSYDQRVQLPAHFEGYLSTLQPLPGQTPDLPTIMKRPTGSPFSAKSPYLNQFKDGICSDALP